MALDNITCPPTQVGGDQRARGLFCGICDRHDASCGCVGADGQPCTPDHRHHLIAASEADGGGRPGRGGTVVRDVLVTRADPHVLMAADVREHVSATEKGRGAIDKRRRARERIRHNRVQPDIGMWALQDASTRRASGSVLGECGWGAGVRGRCVGGTPCVLRAVSVLSHALISGAG